MQNVIAVSQVSLATLMSFLIALLLECLLLAFLFRLLAHVPNAGQTVKATSAGGAETVREMKCLASKQAPRVPMQ